MLFQKGQSGNPTGRLRSNWRKHFDAAIKADAEKHKQSLFEHAIIEARKDTALLAAILRKVLPDLKAVQVSQETDHTIRLLISMPGQPLKDLCDGQTLVTLPPIRPLSSRVLPEPVTSGREGGSPSRGHPVACKGQAAAQVMTKSGKPDLRYRANNPTLRSGRPKGKAAG